MFKKHLGGWLLLLSLFKGDTRSPKYSQSWCRRGRARTLLPRALSMDDVKKLWVVATVRLNPCRHIFIKNCSIDWCSIVASSMGSVWSLASLSVQLDIYWFSWHSDVSLHLQTCGTSWCSPSTVVGCVFSLPGILLKKHAFFNQISLNSQHPTLHLTESSKAPVDGRNTAVATRTREIELLCPNDVGMEW